MNYKEAEKIIKGTHDKRAYGMAEGFLEAVDKFAPAVEALTSISNNSCCDTCQEAKLVAIKALSSYERDVMGKESEK